jgi:seryl-tRNA synthetase
VLDLELIRREPERLSEVLRTRADDIDLEPILAADRRRRELLTTIETARGERKQIGQEVARRRRDGEATEDLEADATSKRDLIATLTPELGAVEKALRDLLLALPNIPDERVPPGGKENNQVVKVWGERPEIEPVRDHVAISTMLGLIDYERGAKLSGSGYWIYTGMGAALEWALLDFFCREHYADGYEFMLPPHILLEEVGYAAGQFPKFYDDVFHIATDPDERKSFLLPTSETAILSTYADEILDAADLPVKAFAYTPCYRRERGSHRAHERGTIRGHQFNKVEVFQFVKPEASEDALRELIRKAEVLVEKLGLHHRTSLLAARDASASMAITYDIEVWIPSIATYKEVSSASYAADYQARRANIKYRAEGGRRRTEFVHTLNASALATSRLLPALLEQNQQPDGSVRVPEVLRAWLGTDVLEPRR